MGERGGLGRPPRDSRRSPPPRGREAGYGRPSRPGRSGGRPSGGSGRLVGGPAIELDIRGELLYGRNGVTEALRGRRRLHRLLLADGIQEDDRIREIIALAERAGVPRGTVPRPALDDETRGANHQGVGLDAGPYEYAEFDDLLPQDGPILILDHLQDPQNIGTLLRAAEAAGVAGVVIPQDRSVSVTPAVVNASAGAVELLPVAQVPNLVQAVERAKKAGRWAIGLEEDERAVDLFTGDLPLPAVLIVGAEGPGIGPNLRKHCDVLAVIPMIGRIASLNASTAGSIALFELLRRSIAERGETASFIPSR